MKYALIIGNDSYNDPKLAQLKTPAADSRALANVLNDKSIGGFNDVISLINQTETEVRRAISSFLSNKKPDDLVLVYFSGHGVLDSSGRLYLASTDTQTSLLRATSTPSSFVADEMDNCRSKRQILILDCCHSGAFARGTKAGEQKAVTATTFEGNGYGRVVLTASDSTQFALEGDQVIAQTELSLFTHFLLEGLKTGAADIGNDGYISLDEWYDYAYSQVLSTTPQQVPHKWSYHQQGELIVARNPFIKRKIVELPAELLRLLESPYSSARETAVKELGTLLKSSDAELAELSRATLEKLQNDDSRTVSAVATKQLLETGSRKRIVKQQKTPVPLPNLESELKNKKSRENLNTEPSNVHNLETGVKEISSRRNINITLWAIYLFATGLSLFASTAGIYLVYQLTHYLGILFGILLLFKRETRKEFKLSVFAWVMVLEGVHYGSYSLLGVNGIQFLDVVGNVLSVAYLVVAFILVRDKQNWKNWGMIMTIIFFSINGIVQFVSLLSSLYWVNGIFAIASSLLFFNSKLET